MASPYKNPQSLKAHGLTRQEYLDMYAAQGGRCAICQDSFELRPDHIDHDHLTNSIRELLCSNCNTGLGMFKDSIRRLACAIVYLEKHGKDFNND